METFSRCPAVVCRALNLQLYKTQDQLYLCIQLFFFAIGEIGTTGAMKSQIIILMYSVFFSLVQCGVSKTQIVISVAVVY